MSEYLLNNFLDKEFQRMLFPLNLMQSVFLQPKYHILHGFITPNNFRNTLKGILGVIVMAGVNFFKLWQYIFYLPSDHLAIAFGIWDTVFYCFFSLVTFAVNFVQSKNNVQFILKMQYAFRIFENNDSLKKFRKYNWCYIGITLFIYLIFLICNYINEPHNFIELVFVLFLFYFDINIIFAIQSIKFLEHEIRLWLLKLNDFLVLCSEPNHNVLTEYLKEIDRYETKLYGAYLDILDAFKLFKYVFQYSVLLLAIELFLHPLLFIQSLLTVSGSESSNDFVDVFIYGLAILWVAKNFALLSVLCISCQQFYLALTEVDKTCAIMCGCHGTLFMVDIEKLCKNVRRVNPCVRAGGGLRAGGALAVDAALPLRLLALLATYTVVLLQFALL